MNGIEQLQQLREFGLEEMRLRLAGFAGLVMFLPNMQPFAVSDQNF
ncbi:hypothetical protein [Salmonella enterica]